MMTATKSRIDNIEDFLAHVETHGKLRTVEHAKRWTAGTLQMLGVNLSRGVKKSLGADLHDDLQKQLGQVFWVAYFRDTNMPAYEFCNRVARRSRGTSDADFAKYPVAAVFGAVKRMVGQNTADQVKDDLSPELREIWEKS